MNIHTLSLIIQVVKIRIFIKLLVTRFIGQGNVCCHVGQKLGDPKTLLSRQKANGCFDGNQFSPSSYPGVQFMGCGISQSIVIARRQNNRVIFIEVCRGKLLCVQNGKWATQFPFEEMPKLTKIERGSSGATDQCSLVVATCSK